jgi:DNA-binding Lrp family transcriptional regulator
MTNTKPKSWRDVIAVHPAADMFPMMTPDELKALGEDIDKHGMRSPIVIWSPPDEGDKREFLLDGRNRLEAAELLGLLAVDDHGRLCLRKSGQLFEIRRKYYSDRPGSLYDADPYALAVSLNIHRRHLTADQKRQLIGKLLKAQPSKSNRQVAKMVGVSHPHVATVRAELEKSGDVETVTASIDTKGRKQPTRKPIAKKRRVIADDEPAQPEGTFPVHFGSCHGGRVATERTSTKPKTKDAPALAPQQTDPDDLIALFIAHVRASGLDLARQIEPAHWPMLIERLREVTDEIEIEADRWAKEAQPDGIPEFLRRT